MEQAQGFFLILAMSVLSGWPVFLLVLAVAILAVQFVSPRASGNLRWCVVVFSLLSSLVFTLVIWRFWPAAAFRGPMWWPYLPLPIFGPAVVALSFVFAAMALFVSAKRKA